MVAVSLRPEKWAVLECILSPILVLVVGCRVVVGVTLVHLET